MSKNLTLEKRMKFYYEDRAKTYLPRKSYYVVRVDGKSFKSYTRNFTLPFDKNFIEDMDATAKYLCENIQGAVCAFVQSDEISVLFTDVKKISSDLLYDGAVEKITSVTSSQATSEFNRRRLLRSVEKLSLDFIEKFKMAEFDSRVFVIPPIDEVANYFIERQNSGVKNSISQAARTYISHNKLNGLNSNQRQEALFQQEGINWNDYAVGEKRGRMIVKFVDEESNRSSWIVDNNIPIFTKDRDYLMNLIPTYHQDEEA